MLLTSPSAVDCTIVLPVYYNEGSLTPLVQAIKAEVINFNPGLNFELIFVDDGSGDGSLNELRSLHQANPSLVRIIKLTRNFGQVNALLAGFSFAKGKCVVAISADGQDPPKLINEMLSGFLTEGYEVVVCARADRDESLYRKATSWIFYSLMRRLSFAQMPEGGFDLVLLGRRALEVFLRNRDSNLFLQGHLLWMGFRTKFLHYHRFQRTAGKSRWTFAKKLTYLIDGVMGYSYFPLRFISFVGMIVSSLGFLYAVVVLLFWLFFGNPVKGWTPLVILVLVLGGTQMGMLGIIGEYLWRTLSQVRNRDPYIIEAVYENTGVQAGDVFAGDLSSQARQVQKEMAKGGETAVIEASNWQ
jgi:dolichol-phosphate mannosyltransferase